MSLLSEISKQGGSFKPQSVRSFFPEGKHTNLPVRLTGLELDENGVKRIGKGKPELDAVNVVFTFQLIDDPESPDPDNPRSFTTRGVDNFQLVPQSVADALGSDKPGWLDQNLSIAAENLTKTVNILYGVDEGTERDTADLVASLQYISEYLADNANPSPELTVYVETKLSGPDNKYSNRKLYLNSVTENAIA